MLLSNFGKINTERSINRKTIEKRVNRIVDSVLPQVLKKYHL